MSATFTSLAYNLTTLRERGILKRLRGTPLPTSAYLAGLAANAIANAVAAARDRDRRRATCCSASTWPQRLGLRWPCSRARA